MKSTELKKIIKVSIDETCSIDEAKKVRGIIKVFKTDAINNLLEDCARIMRERVHCVYDMYIDNYADVQITAYNEEDYVLTLVVYCATYDGESIHKLFRRGYGFFSFHVYDGAITLTDETRSIINVY